MARFAPRIERIAAHRALPRTIRLRARRARAHAGRRLDALLRTARLGTGKPAILMNSPRRPDGPPVRDGKPYSAIAHLAEDVKPFVAMARRLARARLLRAGNLCCRPRAGLLCWKISATNRSSTAIRRRRSRRATRRRSTCSLALHSDDVPKRLPVAPGVDYTLPRYDLDAFLIEAELLLDWYLPRSGVTIADTARGDFRRAVARGADAGARRASRPGCCATSIRPICSGCRSARASRASACSTSRMPLIGPGGLRPRLAAAGRARRRAGNDGIALLARYARARRPADPRLRSRPHSSQLYATLAAQRASKILGIFARLDRRDGKPQYLRHMPRVWSYLQRSLAHPALAPLAGWYSVNVPPWTGMDID